MKTFDDVVEQKFNPLFEAAEKEPGGQNSQAYDNVLKAEQVFYKINDAVRACGATGAEYFSVYNLPGSAINGVSILKCKIKMTCAEGHEYKISANKLIGMAEDGENPCGYCRRNMALMNGNSRQAAARVRFAMMHDERGEDMIIDLYEDSKFGHVYTDRVSGLHYKTYATNLHLWTRPQSKSKPVVWCAMDKEYAFFWVGDKPIVHHPYIKDLMERAEPELWYGEDAYKKGYTHKKGIENAIYEAIDNGAKVLNIGLNPQFLEPGQYSWTDDTHPQYAALAKWVEDIEEKWVDIMDTKL